MTTASPTAKPPGFLKRLFARDDAGMAATYAAVVTEARRPEWYARYGVPDTIDGRFDMIALVLSLVLLRLEREGRDPDSVQLTERFIDDMDGQVREIGFGDLGVGKQVGKTVSLLGGRLGAYRAGIDAATLERTLWRGTPPAYHIADAALAEVLVLRDRIDALSLDDIVAGRLA
jgi:cytochrome b pre-mRNA-processing protein 3